MKAILLSLSLLAGMASAQNVVQLSNPPQPTDIVNQHWMHCASIGFNADHSISGACQINYGSCSGRYCHSASKFYTVTWANDGSNATLGIICASMPSGVGASKTTFATGFGPTTCRVDYNPTGTVLIIDQYPFYYVTTDTTGDQLLDSNAQSYLVTP